MRATAKAKLHRFQMGSRRIQFNAHIDTLISNTDLGKNSLLLLLSFSVDEPKQSFVPNIGLRMSFFMDEKQLEYQYSLALFPRVLKLLKVTNMRLVKLKYQKLK